MNRKVEYRDTTGCFYGFWIMVAAIALTVALCLLFPGCASSKRMESSTGRDSTIFHHIYDTTRIVVAVTRSGQYHNEVQTSTGKQIQFGEGGGTYNEKTGEATNVSSVISNTESSAVNDSLVNIRADLSAERARNDSLSEVCKTYASQLETERTMPKRTAYDRFCSRWFWVTAIWLLLKVAAWIMEKYPVTYPYIAVIRKFVPFL